MQRRTIILAIALAGALSAPFPALAQIQLAPTPFVQRQFAQQEPFGGLRQNYSAEEARDARETGQVNISSREAIMIATAQFPGAQYLDLFLSGGATPVYTVRLKTSDGRRVEVVLDAQTGAVLRRS